MIKDYSPLNPYISPPKGKELPTYSTMPFQLKQSEIIYLIMDYLRNENFDKTLIALEQETSLSLFTYNQELTFLRKLIIDGQWKEVEEFLTPLKQNSNFNYKLAVFEIRKQKFLEEVETEPENNNEVDNLVKQLKELQKLCDPDEFTKLLSNLSTSPSITDQEDYKYWNVISGRLKCFEKLRKLLEIIYPIKMKEVKTFDGAFPKLFQRILSNVHSVSGNFINNNYTSNNNNYIDLYAMLQCFVNDTTNHYNNHSDTNISLYFENDIKRGIGNNVNNSIMNNTSVNLLKSTRNELIISQSMQQDKDMKDIITTPKDNINNNSNSNIPKHNDNNIHMDYNNKPTNQSKTNDNDTNSSMIIENYYHKYKTYNINTFNLKHTLTGSNIIRTSCYSPKGEYLAIGTNSKSIKIFGLDSIISSFKHKTYYQPQHHFDIPLLFEQKCHHLGSVYCLDWSVSGRLLASGSNDKTIKLMVIPELDQDTSQDENDILELPITGHKGIIRSVVFDPLSDLVLFSAGMVDNVIKIWDTENGELKGELKNHQSDINTLKWSNDGAYFASGSSDRTIRTWDLRSMKQSGIIEASKYDTINDISLFNRNNGSVLIAAGHSDGKLTLWDMYNKKLLKEIHCCSNGQEIRAVEFSPDGKYLLSGGFDSMIRVYDANNNFSLVKELQHADKVISAKWHQFVPLITSTSSDKSVRMWVPNQKIK